MGADQTIDWQTAAASALEWWRDAGVDVLVEDDGRDWLALAAQPAAAPAGDGLVRPARTDPVARQPVAGPATLPTTIADFLAWRIGADAPEAGWGGPPIAATGALDARLMVLVDCPDREDRDALLSGAAGRLFDRMLAAIGVRREEIHLASVCSMRPLAGRMPPAIEARLGEIARHHVALARPERLIVMGNAASRAALAMELTEARGGLRVLNHHGGRTTQVVATFHPRFLLERPGAKAEAWKDLQVFIGGAKQ